jgi:hypothetical protein
MAPGSVWVFTTNVKGTFFGMSEAGDATWYNQDVSIHTYIHT